MPRAPRTSPNPRGTVRRGSGEAGAALPISILVSTVLTMLALCLGLLVDVENRIAQKELNDQQVLHVAEAGIRLVVSWFQQPDPDRNAMVPLEDEVDRSLREGDSDFDGIIDIDAPVNGSLDWYKGGASSGGTLLFDKPYRGFRFCTLWGDEAHPEILITDDPSDPDDYLSRVNRMFNPAGAASLGRVRIQEIRVFGPPKDNNLLTRFGVASAMVRAVREDRGAGGGWKVTASRTVRIVLNELPFPPPLGVVETAGSINEQGNAAVHWGGAYAEGDIDPNQGANFPGPSVPRKDTSRHEFEDFSPDAPDLDLATPGIQNLVEQLLKDPWPIPDPWVLFRAGGLIIDAPNQEDQPWPYSYPAGLPDDRSEMFQNQTYVFPHVDYEVWKEIARSGMRNAFYFSYAGATPSGEALFRLDGTGTPKVFQNWVNTETGAVAGLYFFDTRNALNPQDGGPGILTEPVRMDASGLSGGNFLMEGFFFVNATSVEASGILGKTVERVVNMPGEPFLDEGIDLDGSGTVGDTPAEKELAGNGIWDFDIDNDGKSDGEDWSEHYGTPAFEAFEAEHRSGDGEIPHNGFDCARLGSHKHEPFLNLRYPQKPDYDDPLPVDFDAEISSPRDLGGDRDDDGSPDTMTSLRDPDGAQVELPMNQYGILYCEGTFAGQGNMVAFGSMLFRAGFASIGTPDIYFDESIYKGGWPPIGMDVPRVYVTQMETSR